MNFILGNKKEIYLKFTKKGNKGADRSMKWVVESSPAAVTRRSRKTATLRLSGGCHPTERSWMEVGRVSGSFILRSAQQEEALHRIWYALRRWRLVSRRIVLFPTTACSSINRR
ncbi:unnamed protein product [Spirodela intermedia]|uniref:Uncharacterized protein n=1 Tax=Spirodela intermedia TaxID=51605 RepID=A0A7I8KZG6_SPIIN|nr:unnamed protein product [Spirodela intermedia]